jgi:hypothetical protein
MPPATSGERSRLKAALHELDALLAVNDTTVLKALAQHIELLQTVGGAPGEVLVRQISQFEFERARLTLHTMLV